MVTQYPDQRTFYVLEADTKPTDGVRNGDRAIEIDTSKVYLFNKAGEAWVEFIQKVTTA